MGRMIAAQVVIILILSYAEFPRLRAKLRTVGNLSLK